MGYVLSYGMLQCRSLYLNPYIKGSLSLLQSQFIYLFYIYQIYMSWISSVCSSSSLLVQIPGQKISIKYQYCGYEKGKVFFSIYRYIYNYRIYYGNWTGTFFTFFFDYLRFPIFKLTYEAKVCTEKSNSLTNQIAQLVIH